MYINNHDGKHMTGDRMKILLLNLPFLLRDLVADQNAASAMERIEGEKRKSAKNDSISCDLGLRYPLLQSIFAGSKNHQTLQARLNCTRYLH